MEEGIKSRTVAPTNMNATSSRSHAVFTLVLTQTLEPDAKGFGGRQIVSKIHMVDLAGSERADVMESTKTRLKVFVLISLFLLFSSTKLHIIYSVTPGTVCRKEPTSTNHFQH
jgi:hypothetical protein